MPVTIGTDIYVVVAGQLKLPSVINKLSFCICFNDGKMINRARLNKSVNINIIVELICAMFFVALIEPLSRITKWNAESGGPFAIGISCESNPPLSYAQFQGCI